ncbi:MAG TPA: DUF1501 domain-containing protein [Pirellulales bacterium]|nr:DUF1501 domain-containing protein [Pirellulales bacterium]
MSSRREFLKTSSLIALAPSVPAFLARTARAAEVAGDRRVLVVVQLDGGNDGINTVVPFADEGYAKHRWQLRLPADALLKLDDETALHPAMKAAAGLWEDRRLAIVRGVGYPNPNRSHDVSMAIWHTARFDPEEHTGYGWLGRALDGAAPVAGAPAAMLIGNQSPPAALRGRRATSAALASLEDLNLADRPVAEGRPEGVVPDNAAPVDDVADFIRRSTLDAYATADRLRELSGGRGAAGGYPATGLGRKLELVARLLKAGFETRVFYAAQGGYDTHSVQLATHADLLREFSGAVRAFLDDLAAAELAERVVLLAFSEFGRRVEENASLGTDHGTAGPVFLAGPKVQGGFVGEAPKLLDLEDGDLRWSLDFRRVYATVLENWLGLGAEAALGGRFEKLPLFQG